MRIRDLIARVLLLAGPLLAVCSPVSGQTPDASRISTRMLEISASKPTTSQATQRKPAATLTDRQVAEHVLNRMAFGPRPGQLNQILETGWRTWARQQLQPHEIDDADVEAIVESRSPSLALSMRDIFQRYRPKPPEGNLSTEKRKKFRRKLADLRHKVQRELIESVLHRAVYSNRQFEQVIVEFWRNHFNVDHDKEEVAYLANHYEERVLRRFAFGKFEHLLLASARHPAMLIYLDNIVSQKPLAPAEQRLVERYEGRVRQPRSVQALARHRGLNENYARELMELHTLGVDNFYTQRDVIEVSRALTGWSAGNKQDDQQPDYGFRFRQEVHDEGRKFVLGKRLRSRGGEEDGIQIIRMLARHRGTARFIAWKLCRYLVRDDSDERLVRDVARVFRNTRGNLKRVYEAIIFSDQFLAQPNFRNKFKTPFEFVVSSLRVTDAQVDDWAFFIKALHRMGQPIYKCEDPTGYNDQAESWLDPGVLVYRWNFALRLAAGDIRGVSIPASVTRPASGEADGRFGPWLAEQLMPGGLDRQADARLLEVLPKSRRPRRALGLVLGSPAFQQQ